jgi:hypothetical protein
MTGTAFRRALLDPAAPVPEGLTDPQGRPAPRRFAVYRNNVVVGLISALETAFPVVRALVGEAFFAAMARVHLSDAPPRSPLMMFYGRDFPEFLETFPPVAHLPYLADVARLEIALRDSYHAADTVPVSAEVAAEASPEALAEARLLLAPTLRLVRCAHPVHAIWAANAGVAAARPARGPQDVLVMRRDFDPEPHPVAPDTAAFVAAAIGGAGIAAAAAAAGPAHDLTATLALLLSGHAIIGVEYP